MSTFPPHPRYYAVSSRLPRLPRELVHEIFNDLWIQKILEILCNHDDPYLDECAATHITIGKFLSESKLPEIKQAFRLYLRIRSMHLDHPHPHIPILEKDVNFFILRDEKWKKHQPTDFVVEIKKAILEELETYRNFQEILYYIAKTEDCPTDAKTNSKTEGFVHPDLGGALPPWPFEIGLPTSQIGELFDVFDTAEVKLNSLKQSQLYRMADLFGTVPELPPHLLRKRRKVLEIRRTRSERGRFFAQRQFFLVPYNRLSTAYLPQGARAISSGARYQSTSDEHPPCSQRSSSTLTTPVPRNLKQMEEQYWPFAEKDFEWLEGFLSVCGHISSMEDAWTAGQTVAEYWLKHVGQAKA
ncbi:hypothetical protein NMY22_g3960 [Coprinellus aureogranulatus]|nr:hypothetical protein NMY22_g3960 [Coprinellus aureogranulatus]